MSNPIIVEIQKFEQNEFNIARLVLNIEEIMQQNPSYETVKEALKYFEPMWKKSDQQEKEFASQQNKMILEAQAEGRVYVLPKLNHSQDYHKYVKIYNTLDRYVRKIESQKRSDDMKKFNEEWKQSIDEIKKINLEEQKMVDKLKDMEPKEVASKILEALLDQVNKDTLIEILKGLIEKKQ